MNKQTLCKNCINCDCFKKKSPTKNYGKLCHSNYGKKDFIGSANGKQNTAWLLFLCLPIV